MQSRDGQGVDPVPFLVVAGFALLGSFTFVPVYCLTLGFSLPASLAAGTAVFAALSVTAYHRMVWTADPEMRGEVPAKTRLLRVFYGALAVGGVLLLLTLLLLSR